MSVAFFDVDGTIVQGATPVLAADHFRRAGYITFWNTVEAATYHVLHRAGWADPDVIYAKAVAPFIGRDVDEVAACVELAYREAVRPRIYQEAARAAIEHHERGDRVVLLSASAVMMLEHLRDLLPIDDIIAFRQQQQAGRFTAEYDRPVPYGANKAVLAQRYLDQHGFRFEDATYYADSITDLPVLELVAHPRPVNPDLRLRRVASRRGWQTLHFSEILGEPR